METEGPLTRFLAYLNSQSPARIREGAVRHPPRMAVAISRQTGSGAVRIAEGLAEYLQAKAPPDERPWTVFDKNLIAKVLEEHDLPTHLAKFLPEDKIAAINDMMDEILGLHPPASLIAHQSIETILGLAELGNVILVGRGASAITSRLPNVLRVWLVGSLERRVARVQEHWQLSRKDALEFTCHSDRGRARYVKKYLHQEVSNVLLYDLTINTDLFSTEEVVLLIGDAVLRRIRAAGADLEHAA